MRYCIFLVLGLSTAIFNASWQHAVAATETVQEAADEQLPAASDNPETEPINRDETDQPFRTESSETTSGSVEPNISYDLEALPFPTRRMHQLILEATKAGDIEKLRGLIGLGDTATQLSLGGTDGDPIVFLKSQSGDDDGFEILAILEEVLEAGYVRMDEGTEHEIYVWPYFFGVSLDNLTSKQKVELFRIVTYGDFIEFKDFGGYIFYRVGISPTGRWQFFVAGD